MILVTGSSGQLGLALKKVSPKSMFRSKDELDITCKKSLDEFFITHKISVVINCAAYTDVDKAEKNPNIAHDINALGAKNLALASIKYKFKLLHISTDYVFGGKENTPYKPYSATAPLGVYGSTKYKGEQHIADLCKTYAIIRTSWLYSEYGSNFLKSILKHMKTKEEISVVYDQVGSPTYALDLAFALIRISDSLTSKLSGTYHYANLGLASWFDFAYEIKINQKINCNIKPIESHEYPTIAKRPHYSVLDSRSTIETFNLEIPYWKDSLRKCLELF